MPDANGLPTVEELKELHPLRAGMKDSIAWADCLRNGKLTDLAERAKWLPRFGSEFEPDWKQRILITHYDPELPSIVARVVQTVWKRDPRREMGVKGSPDESGDAKRTGGEKLQEFADECTRNGRSIDRAARTAAQEAMWCRFAVALLDHRAIVGPAPITAADDTAAKLDKPYVTLFSAAQVLGWRADKDGNLASIRLLSPGYYDPPDGERYIEEVREVTAQSIKVWRIVTAKPKETPKVEAGPVVNLAGTPLGRLGVVPVIICRDPAADGDPVFAPSKLIDAAEAELRALFYLSRHTFALSLVACPKVKVWQYPRMIDGVLSPPPVPWKDTCFLALDPGNGTDRTREDAEYMEIQGPSLDQLTTAYQEAKSRIYAKAGVSGRASRTISPESAGGVAQSGRQAEIEFEIDETHTLANIATMAQNFEADLLKYAAVDMGLAPDLTAAEDFVEVAYSKDEFGVSSPDRALARCQTIASRNLLGPTATAEVKKRLVPVVLPGLPGDKLDTINEEIDSGDAEPPQLEPIDVMGGAAPKTGATVPKTGTPKPFDRAVPGGPAKTGKAKE